MKKIIILLLVLSSLMFGEIKASKELNVNDRIFTYYCVDGKLYLESYYYNHRSTGSFEQVYQQSSPSVANRTIPSMCNVIDNEIHLIKSY